MIVSIFLDSDGHDVHSINPTDFNAHLPPYAENPEWYYAVESTFWGIGWFAFQKSK